MLDRFLIENCAPTLAGVKTANLFSCPVSSQKELDARLKERNTLLNARGVRLELLQMSEGRALIYVYRTSRLKRDLRRKSSAELLSAFGYNGTDPDSCIARLKERFAGQNGFPHEIGLFLGYPPEDVRGFIENGGQNYMCAGCWKVYGDVCSALRCFERYRQCREQYIRLFAAGRSVAQLTAAV